MGGFIGSPWAYDLLRRTMARADLRVFRARFLRGALCRTRSMAFRKRARITLGPQEVDRGPEHCAPCWGTRHGCPHARVLQGERRRMARSYYGVGHCLLCTTLARTAEFLLYPDDRALDVGALCGIYRSDDRGLRTMVALGRRGEWNARRGRGCTK